MSALLPLLAAVTFAWPSPTREMKPWVYNWWMGSAVDRAGLVYQCRELADKGFGGFHVIPIYGANGTNGTLRAAWREFLSPAWIEAWNLGARTAREHGLDVDLTMGSGWCFGGPWIDRAHAASSGMKVKRGGPGGTGYMLDPFDPEAMRLHVAQFARWFGPGGPAERPRAFYHDSYEYYGAEPKHPGDLDEMQLACFRVWTDWCRENGYLTRNEAHGAPSNWLDFYALADIPETEMFGRRDRDILVAKFASSAAHAKGTRLVSAESCTWVDEHFHERPREIKRFLDRLFLSGVNHVFYHGFCYSPVDAVWPGWCFYASLEMNPRNPIWREIGALNAYVTRCQSLFQTWAPDNDLALVWDPTSFRLKHPGKTENMSVHAVDWFYGEPIGSVAKRLFDEGFAFDYVSPKMVREGLAKKYAAVIDPARFTAPPASARRMPFDAASGLAATRWRRDGRTGHFVVNVSDSPRVVESDVPFTAADPLTGAADARTSFALEPGHSAFLVGERFRVRPAPPAAPARARTIGGPWRVEGLAGGPRLPSARTVERLVGWQTWDDAFSGTMRYVTRFEASGSGADTLDLGDVREIARVRLNGSDLGVRFMPPYAFPIPRGILKPGENLLEIEVTNLGANRLRWNDATGVAWKFFEDINMVGIDFSDGGFKYVPMDASKWAVLESGLLGPVVLREASNQERNTNHGEGEDVHQR